MNRSNQHHRAAPTTATTTSSETASRRFRIAGPAWLQPRERDFGTGYGKSSGYASDRRYVEHWGQDRFRLL
jgi:hypothetical protein